MPESRPGPAVGPTWCALCKSEGYHHKECPHYGAALYDAVGKPEHYASLSPEPIEVIEAWNLGWHAAQVLKYLARAGKKDPSKELEDLRKAEFYIKRMIMLAERKK
jgi:hypothetical protein